MDGNTFWFIIIIIDMAVTFGRIGTTRVGGGARLVCTPDSQIAAPPAFDVTPDAVNWNNASGAPSVATTNTQTITGIDTAITLLFSYTGNINSNDTFYIKNDIVTSVSSGGTFSVNNNDTLAFRMTTSNLGASISVTITNVSDNNTVLDTFTLTTATTGGGVGGGGGA